MYTYLPWSSTTYTHTYTRTHASTYAHTHTHPNPPTHTQTYTPTHTYTHTHAHTHTHTHTHVHRHTSRHTHIHPSSVSCTVPPPPFGLDFRTFVCAMIYVDGSAGERALIMHSIIARDVSINDKQKRDSCELEETPPAASFWYLPDKGSESYADQGPRLSLLECRHIPSDPLSSQSTCSDVNSSTQGTADEARSHNVRVGPIHAFVGIFSLTLYPESK